MVGRLSAQRKDHTGPAKAHVKPVKLKCKFDEKDRLIEVYEALPAKPREERTDFMVRLPCIPCLNGAWPLPCSAARTVTRQQPGTPPSCRFILNTSMLVLAEKALYEV